ncbi:PREDICTED: uncharacterized protein LOC107604335 [Ficedula albicollis]|uniref:uncharacterized protein LOC107604335 n=1 Tax=Ficedula albicollis TaxID=59894 RepID=UPI0007AD90A9|nr:PREDICTED: uncharacterized protein LOC107604335 [Ficedula albicollis]
MKPHKEAKRKARSPQTQSGGGGQREELHPALTTGAFGMLDFFAAYSPSADDPGAGGRAWPGRRAPRISSPSPSASLRYHLSAHAQPPPPGAGGIPPRPYRPLPADSARRDSCGTVRRRARRAPGCRGAAAQPSFSSTEHLEAFPHLFSQAGGIRPLCRSRRASGSSFAAGASGRPPQGSAGPSPWDIPQALVRRTESEVFHQHGIASKMDSATPDLYFALDR